jgi:glycine betaine/proline transport system substrate-binding protein
MVDVGLQYQGVAKGDLDLMLMAWLPVTHQDYWEKVADKVDNLGVLYTHARLGWVVPGYVPRDQVRTIADLNRPGISRQFDRIIIGIDPGSGLMRVSEQAMNAYQLKDYDLVASSGAGMTAMLERAIRREKWVVVTGWSPHWAFVKYDLRYLEDPKKVLGGLERVHVLSRIGFYQDYPEAAALLSRMYLPLEELEAVMLEATESSYEQAVRHYIQSHPARIHYWVTGEMQPAEPGE